ncbi:efflux RND transporter periplasmic adaptor subunit [Sulfoacidibacillus ferrooxidans]|uniref:Membrane fusion protein biotin-lipoyl like domain-containing protein n=1 Tax=Sulfoacidibacillus ferrooxidans TaxID=2005001 RepID=A0A9X1VA49_9BACL|nr:efflux RND transporter periplasmic adaptor subunit [Sulfoacidibacillus ferrooxidans]MCI0183530.1 hypothetical protein [Sulfoacidibacillus ferrooxidans]
MKDRYHLKRIIPTLILTTMVGSLLSGCGTRGPAQAASLPPLPVSIETVALSPVASQNTYLGQVTPYIQTNVSPAISGVLSSVDVRAGQVIQQGQVIATINTSQLQAQLAQAQASEGVSEAELTSSMESNQNSLKQAQASIQTAQANLAQEQTNVNNTITSNQQAVNTESQQYQDALAQFDSSVAAEEKAVAVAEQQLKNAQSSQQNTIAQAQSQLDTAKANLAAATSQQTTSIATDEANVSAAQQTLATAQDALTQAQEDSQFPTSNAILQAQSTYDQAKTALQNAENQLSLEQSSGAVAEAKASYAAAESNLKSAQDGQPIAVAQAQLAAAQQALQSAQNSKSLTVAQAQLAQAKAALTSAQSSAQTSIATSKSQLQQAQVAYQTEQTNTQLPVSQAQVQSAQAGVQVISAQIQNGQILSPISGYVQSVNDQVGEGVGTSADIVTIASMSPEMVTVNVPEFDINKMQDGTKMVVTVPSLNEVLHGHVIAIHPELSTSTMAYPVDIEVSGSNAPLLPGLEVQAVASSSNAHLGIMVPADAVLNLQSGANEVFTVQNGVAQSQIVQVGAMTQNEYQITSGLSLGQELVVQGQNLLSPGNQVTVVSINGKAVKGLPTQASTEAKHYTKHHPKKKGTSS